MRLSTPMRDALEAATRNQLRRTHDLEHGKPTWPAHPSTLRALTDTHGLLKHATSRNRKGFVVETWEITDAGRDALNPPPKFRPDRPIFMSRRGYTTDSRKSIDRDYPPGAGRGEGSVKNKATAVEVVKTEDLVSFAQHAREQEHERRRQRGLVLDAQALDVRLEQARLAARERRMDISGEVFVIRQIAAAGRDQSAARRLAKLETQLQQRAA